MLPQIALFDLGYKGLRYQTHGAALPAFLKLGGAKVEGTILAASLMLVLDEISDRNPKGMKMRELSQRLMVTGGNITGLTDKLVADGLVERADDPTDRRAYWVRLTPVGKRTFRKMAKSHEAWVVELFGGLSHNEKSQLLALLNRLKTHVNRLPLGTPKSTSKPQP